MTSILTTLIEYASRLTCSTLWVTSPCSHFYQDSPTQIDQAAFFYNSEITIDDVPV